ncbi:MAG: VCBS repeat-containing protein [Acidobacteriota bacterium]
MPGAILLLALAAAAPPAEFREHTIATDLKGGYQVLAADLNRDGRPDLIALASGLTELVWFENPGWQRHVMARDLARMINLAAADTDADGIPEIVLASEFSMKPQASAGIVSLLRVRGDPLEPWSVTEIDRLPTSHRLRWANIGGSRVLINAPLAGAAAVPPDYRGPVPLVLYRPGVWKREIISEELQGVMHGLWIIDWDRDGREDVLTASFLGIDLFREAKDGAWRRTRLAEGSPAVWPKCGASEVAVGRLGRRRFLCAIEPWHGHQVAVYRDERGAWRRQVIDESLLEGHALDTADLNRDGRDEIVAGFRGKARGVYVYSAEDRDGSRWSRRTVDESGMAAASCTVADLNGDQRPDIACIGSATANLKWYESQR